MILAFYVCAIALSQPLPANNNPSSPLEGYHVIKRILIGGEGFWDYLIVDAPARRLYISRGTHVMALNADTCAVEGDIPNTPGVHGIAIAPEFGKGFISNGGDGTVAIFDLKTLKETSRIKVGTRPDAIIYDPATRRVFTFNAGSSDATAIDAASGAVAGTVRVGGKPEYAVSDGKGTVYCTLEDKSEIAVIDAKSLMVKSYWQLSPGEGPSGLAIDLKHHRLFAVCGNEKMIVIDYQTGMVIGRPTIGKGPDAAVYDPGSGLAFSSNGQDGTLTIINDKLELEETVQTAPGARTMALDAKTHRIFLVTAKFSPLPAGENGQRRRGTMEPGSFEVLVVGK